MVRRGASAVPHFSSAEKRKQRRVPGQDAEVAVRAGDFHLVDSFVDERLVGGHDLQLQVRRKGHGLRGLAFLESREDVLNVSSVEEVLLGDLVVLSFDNLLEAANRVGDLHVLTVESGELLRDKKRLRQEPLDLPGARHRELVVLRQLIDAENRDDVLQVLVALQNLFHGASDIVVLVADDSRVENP